MGTQTVGKRQPNEFICKFAQAYNDIFALGNIQQGLWVSVDAAHARRIADAYEALPVDDSTNPTGRSCYRQLAQEVEQQWTFAIERIGIIFQSWTGEGQPYADSFEMCEDVRAHRHLFVGWSFQGGNRHFCLGERDPETGFSVNDKFRAVHDLFGHTAEGYSFGPRGEENAWLKHSQMFGPEAQKALTTETRGQNSWVNFGSQNYDSSGNHTNRPLVDRPYAIQKAALLPDEFTDFVAVISRLDPDRSRFLQPHLFESSM